MIIRNSEQTQTEYLRWRQNVTDPALAKELAGMENDAATVTDSFYTELEFGTAGIRGILGAGSNRMNIYTVMHTVKGLALYLNSLKTKSRKSVAIAYDSRINSKLFAHTAAKVLSANGIAAFIYPRIEPTPALSFAVRYLGCDAGICITASHNPAKYNGLKVYSPEGFQLTDEAADAIEKAINETDIFDCLIDAESEKNAELIIPIKDEVINAFVDEVLKRRLPSDGKSSLKAVYTPLNGTGRECVEMLFEKTGAGTLIPVLAQYEPDGNFTTCPYPNPELKEALFEGIKTAKENNADILLATDPDCDRIAVMVKHQNEYMQLNGNELGLLMLDYILLEKQRKNELSANSTVITTVVSSDMTEAVAKSYGVKVKRTLTGFKYIGEYVTELEREGRENDFVFGFEESCGYLVGSYVRDKDAVGAAMIVYDMAAKAKAQNSDLYEKMQELYRRYGYSETMLCSYSFDGEQGMLAMKRINDNIRKMSPDFLCGENIINITDYLNDETGLPKSDVLALSTNNLKAIIRPSGTEPKIKAYLFANSQSAETGKQMLKNLSEEIGKLMTAE